VRDIKLPPGGRLRDRRLQPGEETRLFDACRKAAQSLAATSW